MPHLPQYEKDIYRPQTKLREGNVFAPVCFCTPYPRGVSVGESLSGGLCRRGSLSKGGSLSWGGLAPGGSVQGAVRILWECFLVKCFSTLQELEQKMEYWMEKYDTNCVIDFNTFFHPAGAGAEGRVLDGEV